MAVAGGCLLAFEFETGGSLDSTLTCQREPYSNSIYHAARHCISLRQALRPTSKATQPGDSSKMAAGTGGRRLARGERRPNMMSVAGLSARCRLTKDARLGDEVWTAGNGKEARELQDMDDSVGHSSIKTGCRSRINGEST